MLTQEQKQAIYAEYINRENKVADIADKYGITRGKVTRAAVEMGGRTAPNRLRYKADEEQSRPRMPEMPQDR